MTLSPDLLAILRCPACMRDYTSEADTPSVARCRWLTMPGWSVRTANGAIRSWMVYHTC